MRLGKRGGHPVLSALFDFLAVVVPHIGHRFYTLSFQRVLGTVGQSRQLSEVRHVMSDFMGHKQCMARVYGNGHIVTDFSPWCGFHRATIRICQRHLGCVTVTQLLQELLVVFFVGTSLVDFCFEGLC